MEITARVMDLLREEVGTHSLHRAVLFLEFLLERGAEDWVEVSSEEIESALKLNLYQQIRLRKLLKRAGLIEERRMHRGFGWSAVEFKLTDKLLGLLKEVQDGSSVHQGN